jgi:hypothetical protein
MNIERIKEDAQVRREVLITRLSNFACHIVPDLKTLIRKNSFSRNQEESGIIERHDKNSERHLEILKFIKECNSYCFLSSNEFRHHLEAPEGLYPTFDPIFIFYESGNLKEEKISYTKKHFQNLLQFEQDGIVYKAKYLCCPMLFNGENRILESNSLEVINNFEKLKETSFTSLDVNFSSDFTNSSNISTVLLTDDIRIIQLNHEEILLDNFFHGYDFQRESHYNYSELKYEYHNNTVIINSCKDSSGYLKESNSIQSIWLSLNDSEILIQDNQNSTYNGK